MPATENQKKGTKRSLTSSKVQEVSKRVNETKLEIERLKTELQQLLDKNIKKPSPLSPVKNQSETNLKLTRSSESISKVETPKKVQSPQKIQSPIRIQSPIKIQSPSSKRKTIPPSAVTISTKEPSPKKVKHYDPQMAREYIKKQKELRKHQQTNDQQNKNTQELRKQRLKELHQKTLQLVNENVKKRKTNNQKSEPRRSRSVSRDFSGKSQTQCSIQDKNVNSDQNSTRRSRSVSRELFISKNTQNVPKPKVTTEKFPKKTRNKSVELPKQDVHVKPNVSHQKRTGSIENLSKHREQESQSKNAQISDKEVERPLKKLIDIHLKIPQMNDIAINMLKNSQQSSPTRVSSKREPMVALENYYAVCERIRAATIIQTAYRGYRQRKKYLALKHTKKLIGDSYLVTAKKEAPSWLQPPETLPYPFNFISAVKKKLSIATKSFNETLTANASTQYSNKEINRTTSPILDAQVIINRATSPIQLEGRQEKDSEEEKGFERLKNPDVKLKPSLTLISPFKSEELRKVKSTSTTEISDDSDTCKNIPEISTEESKSSKRKNDVTNRFNELTKNINFQRSYDLDKIQLPSPKIQVEPPKKINTTQYPSDIDSIFTKYSKSLPKSPKSLYTETFNSPRSNTEILTDSELKTSTRYLKIESKPSKQNLTDSEIKTLSTKTHDLKKTISLHEFHTKNESKVSNESLVTPNSDLKTIYESKKFLTDTETYLTKSDSNLKKSSSLFDLKYSKSDTTLNNSHKSKSEKKDFSIIEEISENKRSEADTTEPIEKKNNLNKKEHIPNLIKPTVTLKSSQTFEGGKQSSNHHIHLKFEAELRLLNSFNNSLQQVVEVEKSLLDFDNKENETFQSNKVSQLEKPKISLNIPEILSPRNIEQVNNINFTRGCDQTDFIEKTTTKIEDSFNFDNFEFEMLKNTTMSTTINSLITSKVPDDTIAIRKNPYASVSLDMFDKMIQDEDARIEHLKAILKLREKALFDRTKSELAWLEIQKKQFKESGQISELSVVKKKQRGLLIKYQQEKHEMQRLKKSHKTASLERKMALKEQKNLMKLQLTSAEIPTKIKRTPRSDKRQSGPLKVYSIHTKAEHIKSERASRDGSGIEEYLTITSSVISRTSEESDLESVKEIVPKNKIHMDKVKRALLMKEEALQKRRKEAEELLQWHHRLKEEEIKISQLEQQANSIPQNIPEVSKILTGAELNKFWKNITGITIKKFDDNKKFTMSQNELEQFFLDARKIFKEVSEESRLSPKRKSSFTDYVSDFEIASSIKTLDNVIDDVSSSLVTQNNVTSSESERTEPKSVSDLKICDNDQYLNKKDNLSSINIEEKQKTLLDLNRSISENLMKIIQSEIVKISDQTPQTENLPNQKSEISSSSEIKSILPSNRTEDELLERKSQSASIVPTESPTSSKKSESESEIKSLPPTESPKSLRKSSDIVSIESKPEIKSLPATESPKTPQKPSETVSIASKPKTDPQLLKTESESEIKSLSLTESLKTPQKSSEIVSIESKPKTEPQSSVFNVSSVIPTPIPSESINKQPLVSPDQREASVTKISTEIDKKSSTEEIKSLPIDKIEVPSRKSEPPSDNVELLSDKVEFLSDKVESPSEPIESNVLSELSTSKDISDSIIASEIKINERIQSLESKLSLNHSTLNEEASRTSNLQTLSEKSVSDIEFSVKNVEIKISEPIPLEISININSKRSEDSDRTQSIPDVEISIEEDTSKNLESTIFEEKSILNKEASLKDDSAPNEASETPKSEILESAQVSSSIDADVSSALDKSEDKTEKDNSVGGEILEEGSKSKRSDEILDQSEEKQTDDQFNEISPKSIHIWSNDSVEMSAGDHQIEQISPNESSRPSQSKISEVHTWSNDSVAEDQQIEEISPNVSSKHTWSNDSGEKPANDHQIETLSPKEDSKRSQSKISEVGTLSNHSEEKQTDDQIEDKVLTSLKEEICSNVSTSEKGATEMEANEIISSELSSTKPSFETIIGKEDNVSSQILENGFKSSPKSPKTDSYNSEFDIDLDSKTDFEENLPTMELNLGDLLSNSSSTSLTSNEDVETVKNSPSPRNQTMSPESPKTSSSELNHAGVSHIDVRKRVSEILADSTLTRGDKSPRQDFYVTTYDVISPSNSPETSSPTEEFESKKKIVRKPFYGDEAEELLRKQLEIEQEIKRLEQQQKETMPYCFIREIPNKPPPPYKASVSLIPTVQTIIPTEQKQVKTYISKAAAILYNDYELGKLNEKSHPNIGDRVNSYRFIFNLCKEIALDLQQRLSEENNGPSWTHVKPRLKPLEMNKKLTRENMELIMSRKVLQLLGFQTVNRKDNLIVRWSRKKRDHVDEILVLEAQTEEADWTNYDQDEITVKNNITNEILEQLVLETAQIMSDILLKKFKNNIL